MTEDDVLYVRKLLDAGLIGSPCLELGAGYGGETNRALIESRGIRYVGTDMVPGEGVDVVSDFEHPTEEVRAAFAGHGPFASILVLNVLEHTFDPIRVLDNAAALLAEGGSLIVLTPTVWPLHSFPNDCWRINPDFYVAYARKRSLGLHRSTFEYVGRHNVFDNVNGSGEFVLPAAWRSRFHALRSRVVHKLFDTSGRGVAFPTHVATAVVLSKGPGGAAQVR